MNYIVLCVKRFFKVYLARYSLKNQRTSKTLQECIDLPNKVQDGFWRPWCLFLLIIPILYIIIYQYVHKTHELPIKGRVVGVVPLELSHVSLTKTNNCRNENYENRGRGKPICILNVTNEKVNINSTLIKINLETEYPMVENGGYYYPPDCQARHKVGILVPYRNRQANLAEFLFNIHPFLMRQKLEYRIFVVEQSGTEKFNKGRLYNAGYKEMQWFGTWKCVIFHDVDLLPIDNRILYTCPVWPRHMCATVKEKLRDPNYHSLFGGVTAMTSAQYEQVNGYSNQYWGWGGEDNDMFWRLRAAGLPVVRYNKSIAVYMSLPHKARPPNHSRFKLLHTAMERYKDEGLSTLDYSLLSVRFPHLFTHFIINVNPTNEIINDASVIWGKP